MHRLNWPFFLMLKICLLSLWLVACGFHLRGDYQLPSWLQAVSVKSPPSVDNSLSQSLRAMLDDKDRLADNPRDATVQIVIKSAKLSEYTSRGSASVSVNLSLTVAFDVFEQATRRLSSDGQVADSFQYDRGQFLVGDRQKEQSKERLYKRASKEILRQLSDL